MIAFTAILPAHTAAKSLLTATTIRVATARIYLKIHFQRHIPVQNGRRRSVVRRHRGNWHSCPSTTELENPTGIPTAKAEMVSIKGVLYSQRCNVTLTLDTKGFPDAVYFRKSSYVVFAAAIVRI